MGDVPLDVESAVKGSSADEHVFEGRGAVPGIAIGTAYRYDASAPEVRRESIGPDEVDAELELLSNAVQRAEQELETIRVLASESLEGDSQDIIEAQFMMLRDEELLRAIQDRVREERESAGAAVKKVLRAHRERLEGSDDAYLRDRTEDIVDLERRLLRSLQRGKAAASIGAHSIVVSQNLSATDVLRFDRHGMLGCVTEEGGTTSHVSIIAKALDLPTVVGADGVLETVSSGDPVILDGDRERLIVHPNPSTLERYRQRQAEREERAARRGDALDQPAVTLDGRSLPLRANVELEEELALLDPFGAEGIGLLRTELLFLAKGGGTLSEEQQGQVYRRAAEATGEHGATIRLMDLGGDDRLPFSPKEDNPFLGWRGIRVLLDCPDTLLRPQLRALLRANAHGHLRVLLPMVADLEEVHRIRDVLEEEARRLAGEGVVHDPDLPLGILVEVPAAALQARVFAEHVDFFSVGTNDLTQYVLAVDRGNDQVSGRYDALHPAILGLIRQTVEAGRSADCPVEVCGESAGDLQAVPVLLGLGVNALSVSPQSLPAVRRAIRQMSFEEAQALAEEALAAPDAATVRRRTRAWLDRHVSRNDSPTPASAGSS